MPHHRRHRAGRAVACALVLVASAAASHLRAADVFFDATMRLPIGDDSRMFLRVTNQQYAIPETQGTAILQRCRRPEDDYPTVLFLAAASSLRPEVILDMRLRGLAWIDVMSRLRIQPAPLFAGLDRDPGPPYGNAWGHWKNHAGRGRGAPLALSDAQIVDLAKLQIAARASRMSPYDVAGERRRGFTVEHVVAQRGRPGGAGHEAEHGHGSGHGHGSEPGHGSDHGHGSEHGHGPDHGHGHGPADQRLDNP